MANKPLGNPEQIWSSLFRKKLRFVSKCPICQSRYKNEQTRVIEEKGDAHLIHIECQKCKGAVVALIVKAGPGSNSVGLVTDLTAEDVSRFKSKQAVTENDCIHIHQTLEEI